MYRHRGLGNKVNCRNKGWCGKSKRVHGRRALGDCRAMLRSWGSPWWCVSLVMDWRVRVMCSHHGWVLSSDSGRQMQGDKTESRGYQSGVYRSSPGYSKKAESSTEEVTIWREVSAVTNQVSRRGRRGDSRVGGGIMVSQICPYLSPWKLWIYMFHGKRDFAEVIKIMDFRTKRLVWIIKVAPVWTHESLKAENLLWLTWGRCRRSKRDVKCEKELAPK